VKRAVTQHEVEVAVILGSDERDSCGYAGRRVAVFDVEDVVELPCPRLPNPGRAVWKARKWKRAWDERPRQITLLG
jgi:hypothetical protein